MRDWKGKRASKVDPRVETALLLAAAVLLLGPNYCCQLIRTLQAGVNLPHAVMLSTTFFENCLPAPGHHPSSELFLPFFWALLLRLPQEMPPPSWSSSLPTLVLLSPSHTPTPRTHWPAQRKNRVGFANSRRPLLAASPHAHEACRGFPDCR